MAWSAARQSRHNPVLPSAEPRLSLCCDPAAAPLLPRHRAPRLVRRRGRRAAAQAAVGRRAGAAAGGRARRAAVRAQAAQADRSPPPATALRPYAEQALATCRDGADAVRAHRTLRGGVASFGLPRNAELYALTDLAAEMHAAPPARRHAADRAELGRGRRRDPRRARSRPGWSSCPSTTKGWRSSRSSATRCSTRPPTPQRAARPVALAGRARRARWCSTTRTTATPTPPAASSTAACSRSAGGSRRTSRSSTSRARCGWRRSASATRSSPRPRSTADFLPDGLHTTPFEEPLYDTLAVAKQRDLPLSPATRELLSIALDRLRAFDRARVRRSEAGPARAGRRRPG